MAQDLQAQMIRELQDDMGPPPGLAPSDSRPGPQPRLTSEDPYDALELDIFKPSPHTSRRTLQTVSYTHLTLPTICSV
eukprot:2697865-Alexandrium_andersonii.AAC.1